MLHIFEIHGNGTCIWACQSRNSDHIMVLIADENCKDINNMFDDSTFENAKYFKYNDYDSAVNYTLNIIKHLYPNKFLNNSHIEFKLRKNLNDIEKICLDAKYLDYEDYGELATLYMGDYFCDLIILDGKVNLRYSKFIDKEHIDYDSLTSSEYDPDLTNDMSLLSSMKQKLDKFIQDEFVYDLEMSNIDIKI